MPTAREILNELRWRERDRLAEATIWYHDRAVATGVRVIPGADVISLERRYFRTRTADRLPYYKIERIEIGGKAVFVRPSG